MHPNDVILVFIACLSPPFLAIYYVFAFLFEEKIPKICIRNVKKMVPNCWLLQRILHQNASQYAPKRNAICTKTQCISHQNAMQYVPKYKLKCSKMQPKSIKSTILCVIYRHFDYVE